MTAEHKPTCASRKTQVTPWGCTQPPCDCGAGEMEAGTGICGCIARTWSAKGDYIGGRCTDCGQEIRLASASASEEAKRASWEERKAGHCCDAKLGCCFLGRLRCVCACGKCVNTRAQPLIDAIDEEAKRAEYTCAWRPENDDSQWSGPECGKPARWRSCLPYINCATCDDHKCRCATLLPSPLMSVAECKSKRAKGPERIFLMRDEDDAYWTEAVCEHSTTVSYTRTDLAEQRVREAEEKAARLEERERVLVRTHIVALEERDTARRELEEARAENGRLRAREAAVLKEAKSGQASMQPWASVVRIRKLLEAK